MTTVALVFLLGCTGGSGSTVVGPDDGTGRPPTTGLPLPLGVLTTTVAVEPDCPLNSVCRGIAVSCPGVTATASAFVAIANPTGPPRGVIVFTTGSGGETWALAGNERTNLLTQLRADGFKVVQLRWASNWIVSSQGNDAGTARLACRPATAFKWIHDTEFVPLGIAVNDSGRCGYCITGNSGGATQVSYALSHYGLESILNAVVPTGGPPHAALAKACLLNPEEQDYWYDAGTRDFIDRGFGFLSGGGPCARNDETFVPRWNEASIATGGNDYFHPRTRVHFILGEHDINMRAPNSDYVARLTSEASPWVTLETALNTQHSVLGSDTGRSMVRAALLATR